MGHPIERPTPKISSNNYEIAKKLQMAWKSAKVTPEKQRPQHRRLGPKMVGNPLGMEGGPLAGEKTRLYEAFERGHIPSKLYEVY